MHILFLENSVCDLDFDMTWGFVCVCWGVGRGGWVGGWGGGGGGGGGEAGEIALCKIFIKPKMNQIGDKVRK